MREVDGNTTLIHDHSFERHSDTTIDDLELRVAAMQRIHDRLKPEIFKAF
ncbi:MAG: hypothetical protein VXW65_00220 [Pseudomonadota bacterium]|nr:hypothetical protein [Pseudomonadota bacterium]